MRLPSLVRRSSVRRRLVELAAAVAAPLILLSALSVWYAYTTEMKRQEEALLRRAQNAANAVDREFDGAEAVLRVLAASQALREVDLAGFEGEMRRTSAAFDGALINLTAPDGQVVLSTNWRPGERRPGVTAGPFALASLKANRAAVSDLYMGTTTGLPRVGVAYPVPPADAPAIDPAIDGARVPPAWLLTLYLPIDGLNQALRRLNLPPTWLATVSDRDNRLVARTRNQAEALGRHAPDDLAAAMAAAPSGILTANHRDPEGVATISAWARSPQSHYHVAIGIPRVELTQPIRATLWRVGAIALVLTSLGIAAALLLARRIVGALRSVADAPPGTAPRTGLREIDQLAAAIATAEDRRRATADRFRHLADTMPGWVFMTDAAGRNTYVNTTFQEQTGLAEAALMDLGWMSVVHPADRARVADNWNAAVRERRESQVEYRCRLRDGAYRWFLVRARPILDADGGLLQWFGVAVEIHDRLEAEQALKANEAALRSLNNELEGRVRDEVAARETAQRRAAQAERLQALGQLAGGIAHDFNNILQGVQGAAALIERRAADPTQIGKLARMITEAATRGSAITRRLLAFSRRDHLQPAAVDPGALLLGMKDLLQHTVGDGIEIIVETPPDSAAGLPPLWADKASLETVLINLAINGSDAMSGTGRLGLSAGEEIVRDGVPRTRPVALSPGAYIRLSVSDTGIGMDSTILARASEPFFTTKPTGKGTGLGLAMARGFAEQSGGDLRIESTPGQGTIVHLWLPQAGALPADIEPMARPPRAVHARLLLVDDDEVVRETLTQQMADAGYAVHAVASAAAALAWLDEDEPLDIIVSDLSMPGMDGATMIREALRRRPAVKAILVTGFATEAAADPTILLLQKPITGPDLAEHVALLLAGEPVG